MTPFHLLYHKFSCTNAEKKLRRMYHIHYYYYIPIIIIILEILKAKFKNQVSSDSISYNMSVFIFLAPMKTLAYYSFPKCIYHNSFWRIIKPFIDNSDADSGLSYAKIFYIEKCYKFLNVRFSVTFSTYKKMKA